MTTNEWLTVTEIEQQLRIPDRTIRRYLGLHGHHIQTRKQGRSVYVAVRSVSVVQQIRDWYEAGWKAERVEGALSESGLPVTVTVDGQEVAMTATEALQELQKYMDTAMMAMTNEMAKLRQEVAASREENKELRECIEGRLEERDRKLMEALRSIQQSTERELQENPKRKRWPWSR